MKNNAKKIKKWKGKTEKTIPEQINGGSKDE